jgi:aminopeptidase
MSDNELDSVGANRSRQHLDFMIGSDDIDVTGITYGGSSVDVIKNGRFVL